MMSVEMANSCREFSSGASATDYDQLLCGFFACFKEILGLSVARSETDCCTEMLVYAFARGHGMKWTECCLPGDSQG